MSIKKASIWHPARRIWHRVVCYVHIYVVRHSYGGDGKIMDNPCLSFVTARMGMLESSGIGLATVSRGFENIRRKTGSTSATVCVMSTSTYARRPCRIMWSPESALNTGKDRNPNSTNVAIGRGPHNHGNATSVGGAFGGFAFGVCEQGGAFTGGGCAAAVVNLTGPRPRHSGSRGRGTRASILAKHSRREKPGGSECHLPGLRFPTLAQ
jgi:hypothetical protein